MAWASDVSGQDVKEVEALNNQVLQLHQQGQYKEALALAVKALKLLSQGYALAGTIHAFGGHRADRTGE